jgi:hypothetical protein
VLIKCIPTWGKPASRQRVCIFRIAALCSLSYFVGLQSAGVSQFLSVLLLGTALTLTVCVGVAAWRVSDAKETDITGQIPPPPHIWKPAPAR